jgi:glycosyltransferase involved in cell wall biosynthesis
MEPISVIIPTYNRHEILVETLSGLQEHLRFYYPGDISFLISDDSPTGSEDLRRNLELQEVFYDTRTIPGPGRGLGANLNHLLNSVDTDIVLQMDDDHVLSRPLDITQYVKDLREGRQSIGWIRLMFGEEVDVSNITTYYKFSAKLQGRYWFPAAQVDELYIPSNRPHLKRVDFHSSDNYGLYNETVKLGETL